MEARSGNKTSTGDRPDWTLFTIKWTYTCNGPHTTCKCGAYSFCIYVSRHHKYQWGSNAASSDLLRWHGTMHWYKKMKAMAYASRDNSWHEDDSGGGDMGGY
ncbi:uncharacterized protein N7483_005718 [Penicillium malachiteum]|uniref:uncharacterized protein n=1 Tax=Penicillium malachiteum TaxID=1324776 RepID=UPI002548D771|nr:uncharacterized protein N7483_005718 [Penicillium malachiteum]KAJ5731210.1 hypothetical protein N7483_005718 [Penicillium malachiteum]